MKLRYYFGTRGYYISTIKNIWKQLEEEKEKNEKLNNILTTIEETKRTREIAAKHQKNLLEGKNKEMKEELEGVIDDFMVLQEDYIDLNTECKAKDKEILELKQKLARAEGEVDRFKNELRMISGREM